MPTEWFFDHGAEVGELLEVGQEGGGCIRVGHGGGQLVA